MSRPWVYVCMVTYVSILCDTLSLIILKRFYVLCGCFTKLWFLCEFLWLSLRNNNYWFMKYKINCIFVSRNTYSKKSVYCSAKYPRVKIWVREHFSAIHREFFFFFSWMAYLFHEHGRILDISYDYFRAVQKYLPCNNKYGIHKKHIEFSVYYIFFKCPASFFRHCALVISAWWTSKSISILNKLSL